VSSTWFGSWIHTVAYDFWPVQPIIAMRTPIIRQLAMATLGMGALRMDCFSEPMKSKQGRKAFLHFAASLDNRHLLEIIDALHPVDLPVLIIRGDADPFLSEAISDKQAENLPRSKLVKIPTGSHFIQENEPELITAEMKKGKKWSYFLFIPSALSFEPKLQGQMHPVS
jgi:pimeloyl-ACP methyl ester carboxylesterase